MQAVRVGIEARVPRSEIERLLGQADRRLLVLYARVSGHDQRPDLDRQIERLHTWATAERAGQEVLVLSDLGSSFGVTFTVLDPTEEQVPEQELVEDLLAIIASFAGKLYGRRSQKQKELLECAENVLHSP